MNKLIYFITIILVIGCKSNQAPTTSITWEKVYETNKPIYFCYLSKINSNNSILGFSHSQAVSGGFEILKLNHYENNISTESLYKNYKPHYSTSFFNAIDSSIYFVQTDFDRNTIRTKLLHSEDLGRSWKEVSTPVEGLRKILITKNYWVVEGNLHGTGQTFKSNNAGVSWNKINFLKKGFKNFELLEHIPQDNLIIGKGSKSYRSEDTQLLLIDLMSEEIIELLEFNDLGGANYVKPISIKGNLHGIIDDDELKVYTITNNRINLLEEFDTPKGASNVKDIYMGMDYYIITCREDDLRGKTLSWISYDNGNNWIDFEHENQFKLISNDFGELIIHNGQNEILISKSK